MKKTKSVFSCFLLISILCFLIISCSYEETASETTENNIDYMPYDEYFSEERVFEDESAGYTHDNYIYYCDNWLYRQDVRTWETVVLLKEKTTYVYPFRDILYCVVDDSKIVTVDSEGNNLTLVYDAQMPVDVIYCNDSLIFFSSGDSVYRYYIPSGKTELILTAEDFTFEPISNNKLFLHFNTQGSSESIYEEYNEPVTYEYIIDSKQMNSYTYPAD